MHPADTPTTSEPKPPPCESSDAPAAGNHQPAVASPDTEAPHSAWPGSAAALPAQPQAAHAPRARRLTWQLALGFGAVLGVLLLGMALAGWQLRSVLMHDQTLIEDGMPRLLRVQALALSTEGTGNALLHLMNAPRAQRVPVYADVDARNRQLDGIVQSLQGQLADPEQEGNLRALSAARTAYFDAFLATVDQIEADDSAAAMQAYTQRVQPALGALLQASNALVNRERDRLQAQAEQSLTHFESLLRQLLGWAALAVGLAVVLAWRTAQSVVRPMRALQAAAERIAAGNYQAQAPACGSVEVNQVGHALNTMSAAIAQRERTIADLAFVDAATGLPNRTALLRAPPLTPARNALLLLDLARMKLINSTLGFELGDALILEVARRAHAVVQTGPNPRDTLLARVNGGSFAVLLHAPDQASLTTLHQALVAACAQPATCGGQRVDLLLVCGAVRAEDGDNADPAALLRNAEVALAQAKQRAETLAWFDPHAQAQQRSHLTLLTDLRQAVQADELQMWLQPKFALSDGHAVGVEALVRWQHPTRGFISPAEFVPFAEQTGAIRMVTDWMLAQALATLRDWQARGLNLDLSVNITTRDLQRPGWDAQVRDQVQHSGIDPRHLHLEVVESGLMTDPQASIALLKSLRSIGVELSIDDFGTGYSSLAYVQRLPVQEIKIDRSFVVNLAPDTPGARLVQTMVNMGHALGMSVTAEGVETQTEHDTLRALGCDVVQGYWRSRPLYGAALAAWLASVDR